MTIPAGNTGPSLPKIGFGTAGLGNLYQAMSPEQAQDVLDTAWRLGIRYFDTAPHYGRGLAEQRLGAFLAHHPDAILSTKIGRVLSPASHPIPHADGFVSPAQNDVRYDYTAEGVLHSFEQSCTALGRSRIDIVFAHDLGTMTLGAQAARHLNDFVGSGYGQLVALRNAGRIGAIGLGVNETDICHDLLDHVDLDVILLAGRYTLLEQRAALPLIARCAQRGVRLVMGGVFNSGVLATGPVKGACFNYAPAPQSVLDRVAALQAICADHGTPLPTAALQFPSRNPQVASTLIGAGSAQMLRQNVQALQAQVPQALWAALESCDLP